MPTLTVYPNGTTTNSGTLISDTNYSTWALTRSGSGSRTDPSNMFGFIRGVGASGYQYLQRGIMSFDLSSLPSGVTINSVTLSIYGTGKSTSHLSSPNDRVGITEGAMTNANTLASGDYGSSNSYTTRFATDISSASWNAAGYNDFTFNSDGKTYVGSKAGTIAIFSYRWSFDIDNNTPGTFTGDDYIQGSASAIAGTSQDPKLVIDYTEGGASGTSKFFNLF